MRIGYNLPVRHADGTAPTLEEIMSIAGTIERTGFGGVWIVDSIGRIPGTPDAVLWLLAAAAATTRIEVGTAIYQIPWRNPVEVAQRVLTMHALTGGRFMFGVGTGSTVADSNAAGGDWSQRSTNMVKNLEIIRRLCNGERVGAADLMPWPNAIPGPPILIGAWKNKSLIRSAARDYDGWLASAAPLAGTTFKDLKDGLHEYRAAGGKRASLATVIVALSEELEREPLKDDTRFSLVCHPDDAVERIRAAEELGFDDVLLRSESPTVEQVIQISDVLGLSRISA